MTRIASSVVWRMRLGMLVIWLVVLGLVVSGSFTMGRIGVAEGVLRDRALPDLLQSEHLVAHVSELGTLLTGVASLESISELEDIRSRFDAILSELHERHAHEQRTRTLLEQLEDSAISTLSGSANLLRQRGEMTELFDSVLADMEAGHDLAVDERDDAGTRFELALGQFGVEPDVDMAGHIPEEELHELNTMTRIAHGFEKIAEYTNSVLDASHDSRLNAVQARLGFEIRRTTDLIASLRPSESRKRVALALQSLHAPMFGDAGLIKLQRLLIDTQDSLLRESQEQNRLIRMATDEAALFVADARSGILSASDAISAEVEVLSQSLRVSGIISLSLIVLIVVLIVERQIIGRLARLKTAVIQIADGNADRVVGVEGRDELGQMAGALEVFKSNARELRRSNAELARFAYAASHDLRAPLRAIRDLTEWTIEDGADQMPDGCNQNLAMILQRVDRLSKLLGNLLDYSRVGREEASLTEANIELLSRELVDLLSPNGSFDVVTIAADPNMVTHVTPLTQVLLNLFSNAVKHHDRSQGVIRVEFKSAGDRAIFSVTDDGPGVPTQYHDEIFDLFKTLRARDDVEGSGMGLAIIRKLVEQYGGRIQVHSDPEKERGTTFTFDWPIKPKEAHLPQAA